MHEHRKPLKRDAGMAPLSRDHHFGLLLCWKIRQGLKLGISFFRIADYVLFFTETALKPHFRLEEDLLFVLIPQNNPLRQTAEQQHRELEEKARQIMPESLSADFTILSDFADLLEQHIRFEERTLFTYIQATVGENGLADFGARLALSHRPHREDWPDAFWQNDLKNNSNQR